MSEQAPSPGQRRTPRAGPEASGALMGPVAPEPDAALAEVAAASPESGGSPSPEDEHCAVGSRPGHLGLGPRG